MSAPPTTIHASAVLVGARATLIRGPSASGKSRLALDLIEAGRSGLLPFARLVADDRVHLEAVNRRLVARPAAALAGLIEVRGVGLLRMPYESCAVVELVVDLAASDVDRLPPIERRKVDVCGISIPHIAVAKGAVALPMVLALIKSSDASWI
jgi:HPr kinase/phosphorylase